MKKFEFKVVYVDRIELRDETSAALATLNELGSKGWHVVHTREDARGERNLGIFLEREYVDADAPPEMRPLVAGGALP